MSSDKQIAANRLNAKNSTGPRTERGKRRSRRNAFRHGLAAETVIGSLENAADYEALAAAIHTDYRPRTNFELELISRLVSVLWRLRRAIAIESGLIGIEAKAFGKQKTANDVNFDNNRPALFYTLIPNLKPAVAGTTSTDPEGNNVTSDLAKAFARTSRLESDVFERLGRYDTRLWRQAVQIILLLNSINRDLNEYVGCDEKYFHVRNLMTRRRRALWPPFVPPN